MPVTVNITARPHRLATGHGLSPGRDTWPIARTRAVVSSRNSSGAILSSRDGSETGTRSDNRDLTLTRLPSGVDLVNEKFARVRSNCDVSSWGSAADAPCPDRLGDRRGRCGPTEHACPGEAGGCLERRADLSFRGQGGTAHGAGGGGIRS